jgi:hypothetical protein
MNGLVVYLRANEHIADLRRAAEREQFARVTKRESFLTRVIARPRRRERPIGHRAPPRLSDAKPSTQAADAAAAKA